MRGGQQGAKQKARTEICTVRHEHGIYGDERSRLTNNKSKGSKAQLQGGWQGREAGWFAMTAWHRTPLFCCEMVVAPSGFGQKLRDRHVFSIRNPRF